MDRTEMITYSIIILANYNKLNKEVSKMSGGGKTEIVSGKAKVINPVAEDYNWRISVNNELKSADQWNEDWGFLV
jgi:hypothetical protein